MNQCKFANPIVSFGAVLACAGVLCLVEPAHAAGNAQNGLKLARAWCSSCHAVEPQQVSQSDAAPTFSDIANRRDETWIKAWLNAPHPPMRDITPTQAQIKDLTAYIKSLKTP